MPEWISFGRGRFFQAWSMGDGEAKLDHFYNGAVGEKYRLDGYEPFTLAITTPENYVAAAPVPLNTLKASDFRVEAIERRRVGNEDVIEIRYDHEALSVTVFYCASRDEDWVRKYATVRNRGANAVRVVSIALHNFRPLDGGRMELLDCGYRFSTPLYGSTRLPDEYVTRLGMPAILWGEGGGLLMGVQFPASHNAVDENGRFVSDYRPGVLLQPGAEYQSETAFYLPFKGADRSEIARIFHNYVEETYPPRLPQLVRFNCAGTWLEQVNRSRALPIVPLAREMGAEVFVIDFGGTHYERFPFSFGHPQKLPPVEQVEQGLVRRELFAGGWDEFSGELAKHGLRLGLHYETQGFPHLEEVPEWRLKSPINEGYCMCSQYGAQFSALVHQQVKKYNLGEIKLDYFTTEQCFAAGHDHMADGFDSTDKQVLQHLELLRMCRESVPDLTIALFVGGGYTSPWWAKYADQLHSGDPGHQLMFKVMLEDNTKSEAIAIERRERWHWATGQGMRPPYIVQMDVHGFGIQSTGTIASTMHPEHDDSIPTGAGWRQTLFSNLALTGARDIKLNPFYLTSEERAFVAKWFDWGRENSPRLRHPRSFLSVPNGEQVEGYVHADANGGFVFLFNPAAKGATAQVDLANLFGAGEWKAKALYPFAADLPSDGLKTLPVMAKDCVVLQVERSAAGTVDRSAFDRFDKFAARLIRPYEPHAPGGLANVLQATRGRRVDISISAGGSLGSQRLARRARRLLDIAANGGAAGGAQTRDSTLGVNISLVERGDASDRAFMTTYVNGPDGALVDGCVVMLDKPTSPQALTLAASAPEHLQRALDAMEELLSEGLSCVDEISVPARFTVRAEGGVVQPLGPLFGQAVRVLSPFSEKAPFALADVVVGSSAKLLVGPHARRGLAKPPSQVRGYVAVPASGGSVEAVVDVSIPAQGRPILEAGIGIADQPNPRYGVNLAERASKVQFRIDFVLDGKAVPLLDEEIHPELYPSGEVPEYESLVAKGFRAGFMRRQLIDLSRFKGKTGQLRLTTSVPPQSDPLYTLPVWSVPRVLVEGQVQE